MPFRSLSFIKIHFCRIKYTTIDFFVKVPVLQYVNFRVDNTILAKEILTEIYQEKERFGETNMGKNRTIIIDYSSPNIAKPCLYVRKVPKIMGPVI